MVLPIPKLQPQFQQTAYQGFQGNFPNIWKVEKLKPFNVSTKSTPTFTAFSINYSFAQEKFKKGVLIMQVFSNRTI